MTTPTCTYCSRPYADPRGCEYQDDDPRPKPYGSELHPLSTSPNCRDCAAPKGTLHHAECSCAECPRCDQQWHGDDDCDAARVLTTGGIGA